MLCYLAMIDTPAEREKFEILYEKYKGLMLYVADRLLLCREDAEDAVHQAFLSVIENLHKIAPNSSCSFCDACFTGNYAVDVKHLLKD